MSILVSDITTQWHTAYHLQSIMHVRSVDAGTEYIIDLKSVVATFFATDVIG